MHPVLFVVNFLTTPVLRRFRRYRTVLIKRGCGRGSGWVFRRPIAVTQSIRVSPTPIYTYLGRCRRSDGAAFMGPGVRNGPGRFLGRRIRIRTCKPWVEHLRGRHAERRKHEASAQNGDRQNFCHICLSKLERWYWPPLPPKTRFALDPVGRGCYR